MKFQVQRQSVTPQSVSGELLIDDAHECWTLEPTRHIPAGTYDLTIRYSPKFNRLMPHVENVPGFEGILIHWGNWPKDTEGCTLVGTIQQGDFVGRSRDEFNVLFVKISDAVDSGPQTITYLDPPMLPVDLDGEISGAGG